LNGDGLVLVAPSGPKLAGILRRNDVKPLVASPDTTKTYSLGHIKKKQLPGRSKSSDIDFMGGTRRLPSRSESSDAREMLAAMQAPTGILRKKSVDGDGRSVGQSESSNGIVKKDRKAPPKKTYSLGHPKKKSFFS
jgi:hypothetical protein